MDLLTFSIAVFSSSKFQPFSEMLTVCGILKETAAANKIPGLEKVLSKTQLVTITVVVDSENPKLFVARQVYFPALSSFLTMTQKRTCRAIVQSLNPLSGDVLHFCRRGPLFCKRNNRFFDMRTE